MSQCVGIDVDGVVYSTGEVYPACSEFALVTVQQVDKLTYWADLSETLDPSGQAFWVLVSAMLSAYGVVAGLRLLLRNMRLANREV